MKRFKYVEFVFDKLFGYKFHQEDTYKDAEGKGILQRFLEVGSEYLDEHISPDIDNILDILDIDKTPEKYIGILWEYFGYIPYAYGLLTVGTPYNKSDLATWTTSRYPVADYRNLLKYAISLYKIRCTEDFYTILGRFYNLSIRLTEDPTVVLEDPTKYDQSDILYNNTADYDQDADCLQCIKMIAYVTVPPEVFDYLNANHQMVSATEAILALLNKYLPVHVNQFTSENVYFERGSSPTLNINHTYDPS